MREWNVPVRLGGLPASGITWARYVDWQPFRRADQGLPSGFWTATEIDALLRQASFDPGHDHIFYCHSGVRAATPFFALYLMGFPVERCTFTTAPGWNGAGGQPRTRPVQ